MKLVEIFQSIEGEVSGHGQGRLTTFIRFAGCNLSCNYCDTPHSQKIIGAMELSVQEIIAHPWIVKSPNITITGGEPLFQLDGLKLLLEYFAAAGKKVSIETNGTINPGFPLSLFPNVSWVVDYKLHALMEFPYSKLSETDCIKFVIENEGQFNKAAEYALYWHKWTRARIAFSPAISPDLPSAQTLLDWMIRAELFFVSMNVQIHKLCDLK